MDLHLVKPDQQIGYSGGLLASQPAGWPPSRPASQSTSSRPLVDLQKKHFLFDENRFSSIGVIFGRITPQLGQNRNLREKLV